MHYIVYAPPYSENVGGIIFLHELVHALRGLGEKAFLWPMVSALNPTKRTRLKNWIRPPIFKCNPELDTPLATKALLNDGKAVVIYPEVIIGNPLKAKNVVRWLLYKPGLLYPYDFGPDEMFFTVSKMSDDPEITGGAPELFLWKVNRSYSNENRRARKGVCYIVRKGHKKSRIPETEAVDAIQIDGLTHQEINDIFNRCEVFYSYDEATMYSQFAAICGCLSIVVPEEYTSHKDWVQAHELARYGVAYGTEETEIAHALATRDQLIELLDQKEKAGAETVKRFVTLTKERFNK